MALTVTSVADNAFVPGVSAETYVPDQLIAGNLKLVTAPVTLGAGTLKRGTVLGQITASGNYIESVKTAADGSQTPTAILVDDADASGGAVSCAVYLMGEFNGDALIFDASWTLAALTTALRPSGIFVKTFVSAADPS